MTTNFCNSSELINLRSEMIQNKLPFDGDFTLNGTWQRYSRKNNGEKDEWYIGNVHENFLMCTFGSWPRGDDNHYTYISKNMSPEQSEKFRVEFERQKKENYEKVILEREQARLKAADFIQGCKTSKDHAYSIKKKMAGTHLIHEDCLIVPYEDIEGNLSTYERIMSDGSKRSQSGGKRKGCFSRKGKLQDADTIYLCEGYATACTIYEATGKPTLGCGSVNNIIGVAAQLKIRYPTAKLCLCQDVGKAADEVSVKFKEHFGTVFKTKSQKDGYDFNDLHVEHGIEEAKKIIVKFKITGLKISELMEKDCPPIEYLIENQITKGSCTLVHSRGGVGKSRFLYEMALSLVERDINTETGVEYPKETSPARFLWWHVKTNSKVLYIDTELSVAGIQQRFREPIERRKSQFHDEDIMIVSKILLQEEGTYFNLYNAETKESMDDLMDWADVIIIDNLQNALVDEDIDAPTKENDAVSWRVFYSWLRSYMSKGKTFFLAHHTGKSGEYRGTSRMEGDVDNMFKLERPDDSLDFDRDNVKLAFLFHVEKGRDIPFDGQKSFLATINPESRFKYKWNLSWLEDLSKKNKKTK